MTLTPHIKRRTLLGFLGLSPGVVLAGCGEPRGEPWRQLSFGDLRVKKSEGEWLVTFELLKDYQAPDQLGTFHDVRVHGYDENRSEVCSKELGTIEENHYGGNGLPVQLECSARPTMLTFSAEESPCDKEIHTEIDIATYQEGRWRLDYFSRECGEGLPPEPRSNTDEG